MASDWSDSDRAGLKPSDLSADAFILSDFADLYGCPPDELEQVTYGNTTFYRHVPSEYKDSFLDVVMLACIDDSYLYLMQFWGQPHSIGFLPMSDMMPDEKPAY